MCQSSWVAHGQALGWYGTIAAPNRDQNKETSCRKDESRCSQLRHHSTHLCVVHAGNRSTQTGTDNPKGKTNLDYIAKPYLKHTHTDTHANSDTHRHMHTQTHTHMHTQDTHAHTHA